MANLHELVALAESNPDNWDVRLQLAQAYKELGMVDEALTALKGNPLIPMTMSQSRQVKDLRKEMDPEGKVDMSEPVHPVTGVVMRVEDAEAAAGGEEVLQAVAIAEDEGSAPVEAVAWSEDLEQQGERAIVLAEDVDPDAIRVHQKDSDAAQKASALTVAVLVHVGIALLLGLVAISLPPVNPPQIVATAYTPEDDEQIEDVKITKKSKATAASAASKPTFAISSMASSPIAIPEFDESQSVDVTLGMTAQNVGMEMSFDDGKGDTSEVMFFGIKASGNRVIFIIDASRFMLTDEKGGIPAYNKVKDEIAQMLAGLNRQTAFNLMIYDAKRLATFSDELVAATPSNIRQAIEWFDPINKKFETIGLQKGYSSQPVKSGIEPIPVNDLAYYVKATQRALEMDVSTIFVLSDGAGWHRKSMEKREYEKWMKKRKWGEKEELAWRASITKAQSWLKKENENRLKKGVPRKVVVSLSGIISKVDPGVRHKPTPTYTLEDLEDQMKNAVSMYYRSKSKPRPRFNIVWFVGEDETPSARVEEHFKHQTKRNRGKMKVLKGMEGLKNVSGG
ncbi:MAG: hypothetical protein QM496_00610 [Verrucomicrobiota bacterium]